MSDTLRKDLSDRVEEKITPDSSKSTTDKAVEKITSAADKVASELTPDSSKSTTQETVDKTSREKDHVEDKSESIIDKVKEAVGLGETRRE